MKQICVIRPLIPLFLWLGVTVNFASAQDFLVSKWRNEDGLPHSTVNALVQTHDGYLWIGTYVGLVRFDGVRFVHYPSSRMPELESGRISALYEDRGGTLWIAMESGRLLTWQDGAVKIHFPGGTPQSVPIIAMVEDARGVVWCQRADGDLYRVTPAGIEFTAHCGQLPSRNAVSLYLDAKDDMWVATAKGFQIWRDGSLHPLTNLNDKVGVAAAETSTRSHDGSIWLARGKKIFKATEQGVQMARSLPDKIGEAANLLETSDGRLWLGAPGGQLFWTTANGDWTEIPRSSLQGINRVLYEDHEGNVWRGSFGGGLMRLRPRVFNVHELETNMLDRYVNTICADASNNVWGVMNGQIVRIPADSQTPEVLTNTPTPDGTRTLFSDSRNRLWAGGNHGRLYQFNGGKFVAAMKDIPGADFISALYEDSSSNLWIGCAGGPGIGMLEKGDPGQWRPINGIPHPDVRTIAEAPDGSMWFGTHYGGLCHWQAGTWTQITVREGLPSDYVRVLKIDPDGTVWIGTLEGLCRWRDGKLTPITTRDGLWNNSISYIADDGRGNFWMSSFGGIFHVKRQELNEFANGQSAFVQCVGYDRNDGLVGVECPGGCQPAGARTADGQFWFPTVSSIASIMPPAVRKNNLPPPVWIEDVSIDGQDRVIHHSPEPVTISPGKRHVAFRFTALSLSSPGKVRFRHKLEGLDVQWSAPSEQRTVSYDYLPPGKYTFKVQGCNNDGVWNLSGHAVAFVMEPFIWQTRWFIVSTVVAGALILIFSVRSIERWTARMRLQQIERRHAIERERSRIARDIHDGLGADLSKIVFLSHRAEDSTDNSDETSQLIRQIPVTAQHAIQCLDEIVWAVNPTHDTLESLANYLSQFAREHLALADIRCRLEVPTVLPNVPLTAEVRHNLLLATREALQNIVRHSRASEASVMLELTKEKLHIVVKDNGSGFDTESVSGDGNGLSNMRKRLGDLDGRVEIKSGRGAGTSVDLSVPRARLEGPFRNTSSREGNSL